MENEQQNKNWDQELYDKYPTLFRQKDLPASQTCMCWGICCGEGWKGIIDDACQKLQKVTNDHGIVIEFAQVKEKFGGLRLYTDVTYPGEFDEEKRIAFWNEIHKITGEAEELSYKTCEVCGKPGKPRKGGWISTLCDEHAKGKEEEQI